jgi:hypothetical protein
MGLFGMVVEWRMGSFGLQDEQKGNEDRKMKNSVQEKIGK